MEDKLEKIKWAIKEHRRFNRLRNDLDAYLFEVTEYALGKRDEKPNPKDYGIK